MMDLWGPSICFHADLRTPMLGPQTSPVETCAHPECMTSLNEPTPGIVFVLFFFCLFGAYTLPKTNIAPENGWLEY